MRAGVAALLLIAACGGRGPIRSATDGGTDQTIVDAVDTAAPTPDAPAAEAGVDGGIDAGMDTAPRVDLGDPAHPSAVVVPIAANVGVGTAGKPLDIPMEVAVDDKYFYFVSQVWDGDVAGPWTLFRLPIAGGTAEPLIANFQQDAKLEVAGGFLYYWTDAFVREYDLRTGEDMGVAVAEERAFASVRVGTDGVYWAAYTDDPEKVSLRRHRFGGPAEPELLADAISGDELLAADGGQVFLSGYGQVFVWNIGAQAPRALYNDAVKVPRRTPLDANFLYVMGLGGIVRVPRVPGVRAETLSKAAGTLSSEPVLIGNHIVWRVGSESRWLAVPVWSGLETVPVSGLEGCDALLQGPGRLFCVSAFYQRLSEVSLRGL